VINAASKVNHWLETRGVVHCPYPCVIFKSKDVVMGDIIDLDAKFNTEVGSH